MWHVVLKVSCGALVITAVATLIGATGSPAQRKYHIDGKIEDWKDIKPIWQDAGRSKARFPQEFDVKEVYLDNDRYLYAFLRVKPSLPERFRHKDSTGNIGYFYFDTDNDPTTGSQKCQSIAPYFEKIDAQRYIKIESFLGYEYELALDTGFTVNLLDANPKPSNWISFSLKALGSTGRFNRTVADGEETTGKGSQLIAYSKDWLELALPLRCLRVPKVGTVRILFVEEGGFGEKESYSWTTYRMKAAHKG